MWWWLPTKFAGLGESHAGVGAAGWRKKEKRKNEKGGEIGYIYMDIYRGCVCTGRG